MISNYKVKTLQKTKQTQLNTCLFKSIKPKSSPLDSTITSLDSITSGATMTSMTADLCAVAATVTAAKTSTLKPPMEAVVVNSIIYSKPSFCSIVVDLGGSAAGDVPTVKDKLPKLLNGACLDKTCGNAGFNCSSMGLKQFPVGLASTSLTGFSSPPPSVAAQQDAQLYRMCTTMNGSIHHQISDLCDNLLAMAGFFDVATDEHDDDDDDDDLVEFVYDDGHYVEEDDFSTEDEDEETDDDDDIDVEYYNYGGDDCLDTDNDTVDFTYGFSTINPPKINCDKVKKVHFNNNPTVHVMHTWDYAYRAARKGQWEMYARDRDRFRLRVQRASLTLNPILNPEHRQKIFENRFLNTFETNDDSQTPVNVNDGSKVKAAVDVKQIENISPHTESKKYYQKKKLRRRRFCKMGNKHYF